MKKTILYLNLIVALCLLVACGTHTSKKDFDEKNLTFVTRALEKSKSSEYNEQISAVELINDEKNSYKPDIFSKTYRSVTYNYKITLTLEDQNVSDIEIQELLEDYSNGMTKLLPINEEYRKKNTSYYYNILEVHTQIGDDKYISSNKKFTKNGEEYNPIYEYQTKQKEIERNKKYDVIVTILGSKYLFKNVTKSEINDKYNDIVVEAFRGSGHPDIPELELAPPLDWHKDVDIRKEYN